MKEVLLVLALFFDFPGRVSFFILANEFGLLSGDVGVDQVVEEVDDLAACYLYIVIKQALF